MLRGDRRTAAHRHPAAGLCPCRPARNRRAGSRSSRRPSGWRAPARCRRTGCSGFTPNAKAAASGGVWDRVAAVQTFDAALAARDPAAGGASAARRLGADGRGGAGSALRRALRRRAWPRCALPARRRRARLPHRAAVAGLCRGGGAARARRTPTEAFLIGLARGDVTGVPPPDSLGRAIAAAFGDARPDARPRWRCWTRGRLGEAILRAIDRIDAGVHGDLRASPRGLALLRHVGLGGCRAAHGAGADAAGTAGLTAWTGWISAFLDAQAAERDAARNTRLAYGRDLKDFAAWLGAARQRLRRGRPGGCRRPTSIFCEAQGLSRPPAPGGCRRSGSSTASPIEEGWRADNPALPITGPGRAQRLPEDADARTRSRRLLDAAAAARRGRATGCATAA